MKYYKYLYLEDGLEKKKDKIIKKLEKNRLQFGVWLIALPENEKNQLEIVDSKNLIQKNYPKEKIFVVGLTRNYEDALELVEKIVQEVYDKTGECDIRTFILKKEREE